MEAAADPATFDDFPQPLTLRNYATIKFHERTGFPPKAFQLDFSLTIDAGLDVVCVVSTGGGKSYAFVGNHFFRSDVITWIISPLNVIEHQMFKDYKRCKLTAIADIEDGKYQVVISSPEAYLDNKKLRSVILSKKLANKRHVTTVNEAHCIATWGGTGFRTDFKRIGDMRVFMPHIDSPMCAATATLTEKVRKGLVSSLHIKPDHLDINLGNWRPTLRFGIDIMTGGKTAYSEVCKYFDRTVGLKDTPQALVFVETAQTAHAVARKLRKHYGVSGEDANDIISAYHATIDEPSKRRMERRFKDGRTRIMSATESLTMGTDFPNVLLVVNFTNPDMVEILSQRSGCAAHRSGCIGICIMMVTKQAVANAAKMCKNAGIESVGLALSADYLLSAPNSA